MKSFPPSRTFLILLLCANSLCLTAMSQEHPMLSLGALLPLTGSLQSIGHSSQAAIELGVEDVNAYLVRQNVPYQVEANIRDTATDPARAAQAAQELIQSGHPFLIGPFASSCLEAVKPIVDSHPALVLSPGSSSTRLSLPNDRIFRLVPDDSRQGDAISYYLQKKGITRVFAVYLNDSFGSSLITQSKKFMEERGGHYEATFAIEPTLVDFTEPVSLLNLAVAQALGEVEAASVAVHIIAYEQTIPIFEKAASHPALSQVTWIGNDGFTGNSDLLNHPAAADFAVQTQFVSPVYQLDFDPNASVETLNYRLKQKLGYLPDPITLQSYDAVWLAALALIHQQRENTPDIQDALVAILPWYRGYTQVIRFNANGDRYTGMYVFKTVEPTQTSYRWQKDCAFVFITQDPSDASQDPNTNPIDGLPVKHRMLITRHPVVPMEGTYPLPVLVPITGEISTLRLPILRALQTVETDLNRYLAMHGSPSTVQVEVYDSESNATTSLNHIEQIATQKSSPIIIGPFSSEALRGVKDFADNHGLILLSPGSTAVSLSIANDSIYRLVLDDAKQAAALARYMAEEAIQTVIPVWIDNEYGNSYHSALIQEMKNAGKTISDGISYPPGQTNFTETLLAIDQQIHAAMQNQAPHSIGVVLIGYDEGIGLLASAEEQSRMAQVRWFGSDSYAYSTAIQDNPQAWAFALQTQFTAAYFAPEQDLYVWSIARGRLVKSYFENFLTRFQQDYQAQPGNFTYTTYDAVWLTAMTNFQISPTDTLDTVKRIMSSTFNLSPGYNERNQFSPTGDKAYGTIGFAHVTEARGWDTPAAYHFSSDLPSWLEYYYTQPTSTADGWELYP